VIPAEQFSQLMEGKEIIEKALDEMKRKQEEVKQECEALKAKAQEEGFQEGLVLLNKHFLDLEEHARKVYREAQSNILKLSLQAAKKIVGKELELHPNTIVDIVLQALAPAKQSHRVTLFVNKQDKEQLEKNKGTIKELLEQLQFLNIQEREDVSPGGCIIETESGIINASLENQWRALEQAFQRYVK
jgi:type III secretion protein L